MFLDTQSASSKKYYEDMLTAVGSISRLFSDSGEPYLAYRAAENLFCKSFDARNLSRSDCSADAAKGSVGIGIKTFLEKNGATLQKVAEFNTDHALFSNLGAEEKIRKIAALRNIRLEATKRIFGLDSLIYHCVTRKEGEMLVYETGMEPIDIETISGVHERKGMIAFKDDIHEYSFNISKSTLYRRFNTGNILARAKVDILEDPFDTLQQLLSKKADLGLVFAPIREQQHIFLPLYSVRGGSKNVPEKSGLNQWNAAGRARAYNEVYIPVPAWIHKEYPDFFPGRDLPFDLLLPNMEVMNAKICQDGSKALMSNPNSQLGNWILRDVLGLKEGELLDYSKLQDIGLDSVVIYKSDEGKYQIDFAPIGSFEEFDVKTESERSPESD